jgi:hypothetical protein
LIIVGTQRLHQPRRNGLSNLCKGPCETLARIAEIGQRVNKSRRKDADADLVQARHGDQEYVLWIGNNVSHDNRGGNTRERGRVAREVRQDPRKAAAHSRP